MILVDNIRFNNEIPALHLVNDDNRHESLPLIIFVHGFGSAKEHNLHYAYLLAAAGFRVVLPEAAHHGERESGLSEMEMNFRFWDIVLNEINELQIIKDELSQKGLIDEKRIGLVGTSMGGIVTLGALTRYDWVNTAVSLMGSPYYEAFSKGQIQHLIDNGVKIPFSESELEEEHRRLREYDLSLQPEKVNGRPLLFWHGKRDESVPFQYTYDFYKEIQPLYAGKEENLRFIADENADHKVSREGVLETVSWFKKHLL